MKEVETVKCPHCNTPNIKGSLKCAKCKKYIVPMKSCPRCAKVNDINAKKCVSCNYHFKNRKINVIKNLITSLLLVLILVVLLILNKKGYISNVSYGPKIIAILLIVITFITTLSYGKKDIRKFSAEEQMTSNHKFDKMRKISTIIVCIGVFVAFAFICYYYFIK